MHKMRFAYPFVAYDDIANAEAKDHDTDGPYFSSSTIQDDHAISLLYSKLPRILQQRLPRLRSLRQTASIYTLRTAHCRVASDISVNSVDTDATPPPVYQTQPPSPALLSKLETEDDVPEQFLSAPAIQPPPPGSVPVMRDENDGAFSRSGRYGFSLIKLAMEEEAAASPIPSKSVGRRLYIDGVAYLLRGLPKDLSADEEIVLRAAMPAMQTEDDPLVSNQQTEPPTLLRRSISITTLYTILFFSFLIPYLQHALGRLWELDQRYRLSSRVCNQAAMLLQLLSAQALAIWDMNDGQTRVACRDMGVWVLRDLVGGANEGVGRAVEMMKLSRKDEEEWRVD